jgi:hypothetical protein
VALVGAVARDAQVVADAGFGHFGSAAAGTQIVMVRLGNGVGFPISVEMVSQTEKPSSVGTQYVCLKVRPPWELIERIAQLVASENGHPVDSVAAMIDRGAAVLGNAAVSWTVSSPRVLVE